MNRTGSNEEENSYLLKHLEFIQLTLVRMAANSFVMKGWTVTFVTAIVAFAVSQTPGLSALVALVPCLLFWYLDGFFLAQERRYRKLYDQVRTSNPRTLRQVTFSLDTTPFQPSGSFFQKLFSKEGIVRCMFSRTIMVFYLILVLIVMAVWYLGNVNPEVNSSTESTQREDNGKANFFQLSL